MGKDIKGKELGKGITQRKDDKKFLASFTNPDGTRSMKRFDELKDAKNWLVDMKYKASHGLDTGKRNLSVNDWYETWIKEKEKVLKPSTFRSYRTRYKVNIKPVIGSMKLIEVKPIHCQRIVNEMVDQDYKHGTVRTTIGVLGVLFWDALENRIIDYTPVTRSGVKNPLQFSRDVDFLSVEEEIKLLEVSEGHLYHEQFAFVLETGVRVGELVGLRWQDVDLEAREIHIRQNMYYLYGEGEWVITTPKTKNGVRTIKLTDKAYTILLKVKNRGRLWKESTPENMRDLVFLNKEGMPVADNSYNIVLKRRCMWAGIHTVSMHELRHTMATRFIESSNDYKFLSEMLGHSSIKTTMDTYVHQTDESKKAAITAFNSYLRDHIDSIDE